MSVATRNPFALLDEEASSPASPPAAPAPAAAAAPAARGNQKSRGGPAARGGKYYARGGAKPRTDDGGNLNQNGIDDAPQDKKFDGRGRGRGGPRGAPRGRGRQFDKHSQTGKVDSDKKINQGWGAEEGKAELKAEQAAISDAKAETPSGGDWGAPAGGDAGDWAAPAAEGTAGANADKPEREGRPRREREPEEEDNTLTLEQYLAQQKDKTSDVVPKLEGTRKIDTDWKDVVAIDKPEGGDEYFVGKTKAAPKARAKKEEKVFIEIDARFERPSRGGPRGRGGEGRGGEGRGGRGAGRGAPRGAPRGGRPAGASTAVDVDDEKAFPTLS